MFNQLLTALNLLHVRAGGRCTSGSGVRAHLFVQWTSDFVLRHEKYNLVEDLPKIDRILTLTLKSAISHVVG